MLKSSLFRTGRWIAVLGSFAAAAGCDTPFGLRESNGVSADARNQQVIVTNNSASPIFTFVIGRIIETRTDYILCVDAARCPPIQTGGSRVYPYETLMREPGEREVVVRWWHAVPDGSGGLRAGNLGSLIVPLY
jgi:hypothetical protein